MTISETSINLPGDHLNKDNKGRWSLRLESMNASLQIPEKLALLIQTMLKLEDDRSDGKTAEILRKINCHKATLYLAGLVSYDDFISDPKLNKDPDFSFEKRASAISTKDFIPVKDDAELRKLAMSCCEVGKIYIGQIFNENLGHSFIVGRTENNKFICFDKAGFTENPSKNNKDFKFRVYEIGKLLESPNYQKAAWRFVAIDEIRS